MRLFSLVLCLGLFSCQTTPPPKAPEQPVVDKCPAAELLGTFLTQQVSTAVGCKNQTAVKKSMVDAVYRAGMCKEYEQSTFVYELICGKLGNLIRGSAVVVLPKAWECDGGLPAQAAYDYIYKACVSKLTK